MLFREMNAVYFENHEKNGTESRRTAAADLIKLAQDGESRVEIFTQYWKFGCQKKREVYKIAENE